MEQENKVLTDLGLFGITCLAILVFCSLSFCCCLTIHVRWIYTVICPLLSIVNCVSSCLRKFRVRHREKPTDISDIEARILNSKSAKKVGRQTSQSILLRDLQTVSPRLTDFFRDLEIQERENLYRRNFGQIPAAELRKQNFGLQQTSFVEVHQTELKDFSNKSTEQSESSASQEQRLRRQESCRIISSQPIVDRASSASALSESLPQTTLIKSFELGCPDY